MREAMTFNDPPDFGPGSAAEITATLQLPASELALDIVYVAGESKCVIRAEFPTAGAKRTARRYALPSNRLPAVLRWAADSSGIQPCSTPAPGRSRRRS